MASTEEVNQVNTTHFTPPKLPRRNSHPLLENPAEMLWILKPQFVCLFLSIDH